MTITFVHNKKAFLPEVTAYIELFERLGIRCKTALPEEIDRTDTDVEWYFMGMDTHKAKGRVKIHEYLSGSIAPYSTLKDLGKKILNTKPDFRLFLNPYVKKRFGFNDKVPFGYRDMGVKAEWLTQTHSSPASWKYDFVYVGDLSPARRPEDLLDVFTKSTMKDKTLLIISNHYSRLQTLYSDSKNIVFEGPYEHSVIRSMLSEARYGINYIVDKEPFNRQTSTKFLEYAACGLPIISTQYKWIEEFKSTYGGQYYFLNHDLSNFRWESIEQFDFASPDLADWTWEKQIKASGVLEFLHARFKN